MLKGAKVKKKDKKENEMINIIYVKIIFIMFD